MNCKMRLAAGLTTGVMMLSMTGPAFAAPAQINAGSLVSALNNANIEINDVLNNNQTDIAVLQDFLKDSVNNNVQIIKDALNDNNVAISDVVAIDVPSGGDVVVFVQ